VLAPAEQRIASVVLNNVEQQLQINMGPQQLDVEEWPS